MDYKYRVEVAFDDLGIVLDESWRVKQKNIESHIENLVREEICDLPDKMFNVEPHIFEFEALFENACSYGFENGCPFAEQVTSYGMILDHGYLRPEKLVFESNDKITEESILKAFDDENIIDLDAIQIEINNSMQVLVDESEDIGTIWYVDARNGEPIDERWIELYKSAKQYPHISEHLDMLIMDKYASSTEAIPWRNYVRDKMTMGALPRDFQLDFICWAAMESVSYDRMLIDFGWYRDDVNHALIGTDNQPSLPLLTGVQTTTQTTQTKTNTEMENIQTEAAAPQTAAPVQAPSIVPAEYLIHDASVETEYKKWFDAADAAVTKFETATQTTSQRIYSISESKTVTLYATGLDMAFRFDAKEYNGRMSKSRKAYIFLTDPETGTESKRQFKQNHNAIEFIDEILTGADFREALDKHCNPMAKTPSKKAEPKPAPVAPTNAAPEPAPVAPEPAPVAPTNAVPEPVMISGISDLVCAKYGDNIFALYRRNDGKSYAAVYNHDHKQTSIIESSYEATLSNFKGAESKKVLTFIDCPDWLKSQLSPKQAPSKTVDTKTDDAILAKRKAAAEAAAKAAAEKAAAKAAEKAEQERKDAEAKKAAAAKEAAAKTASLSFLTYAVTGGDSIHIKGLTAFQMEMVKSYIAGMNAAMAAQKAQDEETAAITANAAANDALPF